jgi:hypothetical protein
VQNVDECFSSFSLRLNAKTTRNGTRIEKCEKMQPLVIKYNLMTGK